MFDTSQYTENIHEVIETNRKGENQVREVYIYHGVIFYFLPSLHMSCCTNILELLW